MKNKALVPIEQALVPFYEWVILAVRLSDGRIAASLSSLCRMLNLDRVGQMQRIRRDVVLAGQLLQVVVQTPGGPQVIDVLTAWAIPTWLTGLNPEMVAPEKRPLIVTLKLEAADVLYRHFFKIDTDQTSRPAPEEPAAPHATRPTRERTHAAPASPWELIYGGLEMLATGMEGLEREQQAMYSEIVLLKGQVAEMQRRREERDSAGPAPQPARVLSLDHILQLYTLARVLEQQTGEPVSSLLRALADQFSVADASSIPDANWDQVRAWLWQRAQL